MKKIDVEYYEYDCGKPCTVDGCMGHETDIPVSITINGVRLVVEGADEGDFPSKNKEYNERVKYVIEFMAKFFKNINEYTERTWDSVPYQYKEELSFELQEMNAIEPWDLDDIVPEENL